MVCFGEVLCPNCGGLLKHYDRVSRLVRSKDKESRYVRINRLRCTKCHELHRELPDNLRPYKHYEADIIEGVEEGFITPDTKGFEDFPCEMTMTRWRSHK